MRGCSLRNTEWVFGVVAYTGHDTKIMLNSTVSRSKYSSLEEMMGFFIILIFFLQLTICLFSAENSTLWQYNNRNSLE